MARNPSWPVGPGRPSGVTQSRNALSWRTKWPSLVISGSCSCHSPLISNPIGGLHGSWLGCEPGRNRAEGNLLHQLAGHGLAETGKVMHLQNETARAAGDVLAVVIGQPAGRLDMGEGPGHRMVVDDRQPVDGDAGLDRIVARIAGFPPSVVGAIATDINNAPG